MCVYLSIKNALYSRRNVYICAYVYYFYRKHYRQAKRYWTILTVRCNHLSVIPIALLSFGILWCSETKQILVELNWSICSIWCLQQIWPEKKAIMKGTWNKNLTKVSDEHCCRICVNQNTLFMEEKYTMTSEDIWSEHCKDKGQT